MAEPYIPGQTSRPTDGSFDTIRATAQPGMSSDQLAQSEAFQTGLKFLQSGWFWEAHEVLEPVWMAAPPNSRERLFVRALIQLANARLKDKMHRPQAAARLRREVQTLLTELGSRPVLTMNPADVGLWLEQDSQ